MSIDFDAFLHADIARENIASSDPPEDEPPPAPVGMEEIDDALLTVEMASENVALDNGRATIRRRDEAHDTLMMLIRSALAARDERIAALESEIRDAQTFGAMQERLAASGYKIVDDCCVCGCNKSVDDERIAALEVGLREAADLGDQRVVAVAEAKRWRAIADAGKAGA